MPKKAMEIGDLVMFAAEEIFEVCGAPQDFCVQAIGETVVFGGTNRLIWHPIRGFRPDPSYCTDRFLSEFRAHYGR